MEKRDFLPILSLISKYPFLRISGIFLNSQFGSIEEIMDKARDSILIQEAFSKGKEIVKAILKDSRVEFESSEANLLCTSCDIRCYCEKFLTPYCHECAECFRNCRISIGEEYYRESLSKAKESVLSYLYSRILVSHLETWAIRKFAVKSAEIYHRFLVEEGSDVLDFITSDLGIKRRSKTGIITFMFRIISEPR